MMVPVPIQTWHTWSCHPHLAPHPLWPSPACLNVAPEQPTMKSALASSPSMSLLTIYRGMSSSEGTLVNINHSRITIKCSRQAGGVRVDMMLKKHVFMWRRGGRRASWESCAPSLKCSFKILHSMKFSIQVHPCFIEYCTSYWRNWLCVVLHSGHSYIICNTVWLSDDFSSLCGLFALMLLTCSFCRAHLVSLKFSPPLSFSLNIFWLVIILTPTRKDIKQKLQYDIRVCNFSQGLAAKVWPCLHLTLTRGQH